MNITIYKQKNKKKTKMNYKKTKRRKYKKTKRNEYKKTKRKYNTKRRKYNKRGGADAARENYVPAHVQDAVAAVIEREHRQGVYDGTVAAESIPTETEFPDPEPLDLKDLYGKRLYVSKSLNEDDDYDLIYFTNLDGRWIDERSDLGTVILNSDKTKISLLLNSLGEYIPLDPDFSVKKFTEEDGAYSDYDNEDITGKVLFEVTKEFIESKKSGLFIERLKHCKTCVIGAGPGYNNYSGLDDFHRWRAHDPYFIGFSHMDTLLIEPFTANWLKDPHIFEEGFRICQPHLQNGKFEHIFIDRGTIQHLDEGGTDAFTPLLEAIISTDISDRLFIDDMFFRRMFEDLLNEDIPKMEYYRIPRRGGGFYKDETGAQQVKIADLRVSAVDIKKPENKINTLAELKSDPKILIKSPDVYGYALCASRFLQSIDYTDKGELILRHFNRTQGIIEIDNGGRGGKNTFHVFTKRT